MEELQRQYRHAISNQKHYSSIIRQKYVGRMHSRVDCEYEKEQSRKWGLEIERLRAEIEKI